MCEYARRKCTTTMTMLICSVVEAAMMPAKNETVQLTQIVRNVKLGFGYNQIQ